ncbi:MAG: RNA degradosome polyphosphate kinase [Acidimicrobiia bacterium]|nr:RNA degradosome polyphosphate kinase [Acidimicrobiia bacterium]
MTAMDGAKSPVSDRAPVPGPPTPGAAAAGPDSAYLNRELSWLDFNARVLALAEDPARPLLERAKFLAIFNQNLDEFFQVRVSAIRQQVEAGLRAPSPDGLDAAEVLAAVRAQAAELVERQTRVFTKEVAPALEDVGIRFSNWHDLDDDDRAHLVRVFEEQVFPVLTPLAVDPAHPFPYISSLSLSLAVLVHDPDTGEQRFARVKVPPLLPRFVVMPDGERFVPLEQVIAAHLDALFPGMQVLDHHPFRVTRDADYELEDEAEDLLEAMEDVVRRRTKFGPVVRLEVDTTMSEEVLDLLCRELELSRRDVYVVDGPLDLSGLWALYALPRPELKDDPWVPQTPPALAGVERGGEIFRVLEAGDVLVHHPYDSFATTVETFIDRAARDPQVLAIKQTLYRTAGPESKIVGSLIRAAEAGKQVVVLVELKARFDEQANIERARRLEEAGVHVVYGFVGLKTHTKVVLVVRQEPGGVRRYCHVGTGNYNPRTADIYEDLGILSADPELGADIAELFNHLTGYSHQTRYRKLLVAPAGVRRGILARIGAQARPGGRIVMKMNALVDPPIIDALYEASQAGAEIDLVVRGICCLRPGVPGLSERIRVRSIVGRFLEHSRIFRFGDDPATAEYLVGSADLMPRNLDRRVEALAPVEDPRLRARLDEILAVNLADDVLAWELAADGVWHKVPTVEGVDTHRRLQALALQRTQAGRAQDART